MESKAHALAAGIFTIVLGAAVLLAAMWLSGETYEKAEYLLESKYPITGLNEQAVVRFRGVDVGRVGEIRFDPNSGRVILIRIGIHADTPVTRSTYAEVRPQGVTGISYIMLDDKGGNTEPLPPLGKPNSARILVRQTLLESLLTQGQEVLGDVRLVAQRVAALLSAENQAALTSTLASARQAADRLAALTAAAEPGVRNMGPLTEDARKTLERANALMADLSTASKEFASRMEAIDRMAGSAEQAGGSIKKLADSVTNESLPRINSLVDQLSHTSRNLDRFVTDVKQQPQSLVFGRKPDRPGPGEPGFDSSVKGAK
jgi:phospholipid/cholesterol/gamma-HCH transport system substrate-binding protein